MLSSLGIYFKIKPTGFQTSYFPCIASTSFILSYSSLEYFRNELQQTCVKAWQWKLKNSAYNPCVYAMVLIAT